MYLVYGNLMATSTLCSSFNRFMLQRCSRCLVRRAVESSTSNIHLVQFLAPFSVTRVLENDPNRPKKSGDRGPHKNYVKKMNKRNSKENDTLLSSLLEGMKMIEKDRGSATTTSALESLGEEGLRESEALEEMQPEEALESTETEDTKSDDLYSLLAKLKMQSDQGSEAMHQRRPSHYHDIDSGTPQLSMKGDPISFMPSSGDRLGWFSPPPPNAAKPPPEKMTLAEEDEMKKLQALLLLKPRSYFEDLIEGTDIRYPRKFPIDNEDYDQGEEANVGFEDHVLLDHLLKGLPTKGPVRHFMELVVTGLSKNPHYTAAEKREYVQWYKDYFSQFSEEELK